MSAIRSGLGMWLEIVPAIVGLLAGMAQRAEAVPQHMKITFAGYTNRIEVLTNFPVLVVFSNNVGGNSSFNYSNFISSNGYDLWFGTNSESTTNSLNYEIESWNTNGTSYVWVQVPTIPGDGAGAIWANWGNASATNQLPCTTNGAVWTNGFAAVWHLGEAAGNHLDSATNPVTATRLNNTVANGMIGNSQSFNGTTAAINCGNDAKLRPQYLSISAWVNPNNITTNRYYEIYRKEDGNDRHLFSFQEYGTILSFGIGPTSSYAELDVPISASDYTGAWHYVVCTYDNAVKNVFRDGVIIGSTTTSGALSTSGSANGYIGCYSGGSEWFDGLIDEVRISSVGRSSNWVWAEYLNMASNTVFNNYGAMERPPLAGTVIIIK